MDKRKDNTAHDEFEDLKRAIQIFIPIYILLNLGAAIVLWIIKLRTTIFIPWFAVFIPLWAPFAILIALGFLLMIFGILCAMRLNKKFEFQDENFVDKG